MASRSVSPGGALLRASRVFSIPPPLPRPTTDLSATATFQSDTATLHHPIHLSITTPQSSLAKGDWGFKRPLPRRSTTRTSTPIIRVEAIDTYERITEFGSAADHSLTLQKWHEMGVPITTPPAKTNRATELSPSEGTGISVFEDKLDSTVLGERGLLDKDDTRWKFKGPWFAGLNEGEFNDYVLKQVRGRKLEFREFLRTALAEAKTREQRRLATEREGDVPAAVQSSEITEEELDGYIKVLRKEIQPLFRLIRKFLDLPPPPNRTMTDQFLTDKLSKLGGETPINIKYSEYLDLSPSNSPYADTGPPKTHPSAGLSYSRSDSYTYNHPVYGPQKYKAPVQARVVMPKAAATGSFAPVLGVGGFVVNTPAGDTSFQIGNQGSKIGRSAVATVPGIQSIVPSAVGGSKVWMQPKSASIDSKGKVILLVASADPESVAVMEDKTDVIPPRPVPGERRSRLPLLSTPLNSKSPKQTSQSLGLNRGYGISGSDFFKR